jgi:hypothetical protein
MKTNTARRATIITTEKAAMRRNRRLRFFTGHLSE